MKSHFLKKIVSLVLCLAVFICALTSNVFADSYVWYATDMGEYEGDYRLYYWNNIPSTVYVFTFSGVSVYYETGMRNSISQWNSALNRSMVYTANSAESSARASTIKFFSGTKEQLSDLGIFDYNFAKSELFAGYAQSVLYRDSSGDFAVDYRWVYKYILSSSTCFVREFDDIRNAGLTSITNESTYYRFVCLHEMGHAMGWYGHSSDNSGVMRSGIHPTTTLRSSDILHISQFY